MIIKKCLQCGKDFDVIFLSRTKYRKFCSIECSGKAHIGKGNARYGKKHSTRTKERMKIKARGRNSGEKSHTWKGGRAIDGCGYINIYSPNHPFKTTNNRVLEHRLVMEKHIGRYLKPKEVIHHKGIKYPLSSIENRQDNRIENLTLCINESKHREMHKTYHNKFGQFTHKNLSSV